LMKRLLDDLLDVSRLTRGKVRLEMGRVDLARVLADAVETSRPLIEQRGHVLTVSPPAPPVQVEGDAARLTQVVTNLLNNAARYTPSGGSISLSAERDGAAARIRVRDNGIGMTPEVLARAFEPFAQGERALARSEGGLGIGLALVRELTELHGGTVSAQSAGPGCGSEFTVTLPLVAEGPHSGATDAPAPPPGGKSAQECMVLVVDDDPDLARGLALLLESGGYAVCTARDAASALAAAHRSRPQVAIVDLGLPEVDGYTLARQLRAEPEIAPEVLIALSGYGNPGDRQAALGDGFDHHLTKPVVAAELLEVVAAAMRHRLARP
ncbi:MAG TPA: hybrid sensor histidine kinase/response regulator, partial [Armatimonadota bacterium]|nr:hybrid sensor histidine kinase/response regulator [Armatimonadota bacterium]